MVEEMMRRVYGYTHVEIFDPTPPLAPATFDTPVQPTKFIQSNKKNATVQTNKKSVSEADPGQKDAVQRSLDLGAFDLSNVSVHYKNFKVTARINLFHFTSRKFLKTKPTRHKQQAHLYIFHVFHFQ